MLTSEMTQSPPSTNLDHDDNYEQSCYCPTKESTSSEVGDEEMQRETSTAEQESELSDHIMVYKEKLDAITSDMLIRCQSGDCNLISGLNRFVCEYGR